MDVSDGIAALQETDEWGRAESCRTQVTLIVQGLHSRPVETLFRVIGTMFTRRKEAVVKEYEKNQHQAVHTGLSLDAWRYASFCHPCSKTVVGMLME
jgi:hypothetical protein